MSEVMEREKQTEAATQTAPQPAAPETVPAKEKKSLRQKWKGMPRKKRRRIVRWFFLLLILAAIGAAVYYFRGSRGGGDETQVMTDIVQYGSITSTVEDVKEGQHLPAITYGEIKTLSDRFEHQEVVVVARTVQTCRTEDNKGDALHLKEHFGL